jgi:hypothetical protein
MGQYYLTVNLDKKQFIHPHKLGDGLKLLEFGCSSNGTMTALAVLLADGNGRGGGDLHVEDPIIGSWAGDRIVVAGDYADNGRFVTKETEKAWRKVLTPEERKWRKEHGQARHRPNLFYVAEETFEDISEKVIDVLRQDEYIRESLVETGVLLKGGEPKRCKCGHQLVAWSQEKLCSDCRTED